MEATGCSETGAPFVFLPFPVLPWYSAPMNEDASFQTPPVSEQLLADAPSNETAAGGLAKVGAPSAPSSSLAPAVAFAAGAVGAFILVRMLRA